MKSIKWHLKLRTTSSNHWPGFLDLNMENLPLRSWLIVIVPVGSIPRSRTSATKNLPNKNMIRSSGKRGWGRQHFAPVSSEEPKSLRWKKSEWKLAKRSRRRTACRTISNGVTRILQHSLVGIKVHWTRQFACN